MSIVELGNGRIRTSEIAAVWYQESDFFNRFDVYVHLRNSSKTLHASFATEEEARKERDRIADSIAVLETPWP